ncbi:MAG: hypothetical protein A2605_01835 [Candidatus Zambryskibacteria bacterium RIFOXYD1_FULL_39_35]|nr:MAG: hypothetical protein A2605_01835 [Candidatus Zambryskibacteria bacterium RIFOXYD1_FULL_39_35]
MTDIIIKNSDFMDIYNKSYRLAAAVFLISNVIENNDELKTKMKKLSLDLVSMSVNLKDISFDQTNNLLRGIEKNALELISMLDIASVSGLISEMNGRVIKGEFQAFISELNKFSDKSNEDKNSSVKSIFADINKLSIENNFEKTYPINNASQSEVIKNNLSIKNGNGHKRKDTRKNMILEFIKGHNNASIKDIVPNITGCSEKTVQRELIALISENKIKKVGERRWSRYFVA